VKINYYPTPDYPDHPLRPWEDEEDGWDD